MRRWRQLLVLALLIASVGGSPVLAQDTPPFVWNRYDVEIVLQPDGSFTVAETQELRIDGTLRKGYREVPLDRVAGISDLSVEEPGRRYTSGSGQPYTFAATREEGNARVEWWFPPTRGGTKTFILRYRVDGGIRVYEGGDQLRWNAVYADRPAPVLSSTVTLRFPRDVAPEDVRLATYPERLAAQTRLADPRTAQFEASEIPAGQPFQIRVQFPHGLVAASPPSWQAGADLADWFAEDARPVLNFLSLLGSLAILVLGGLWLAGRWYTRGRDPGVGAVPPRLSEPPSDLPAGVVGTLVDERADVQDVVASLVELGNRGVLRMAEERNPELQGSSLDYRLELLKPDPTGLRAYEKTVLATLFPGDAREVRLSDLKHRFVASIPLFQAQLHAEVVRAGLFHGDPEQARRRYQAIGNGLLFVGLGGGLVALFVLGASVDLAWLPFLALALLGGFARWLAGHMPRRTRRGALEAARWRAFARFLRERDDAHLQAERPHFEAWLPYAVALGVDESWVRNLATVGTPRPHWYRPAGHGDGVGGGPVVVMPSPWGWGGTVGGGNYPGRRGGTGGATARTEPGGWGDSGGSGGLQGTSDSLADLLNRTSEILSRGGGDGWSGGGFGGGGGGGGGGSGGGSGGFS